MGESAREKLERVFFEAVELKGAAREEYLLSACAGDAGLLAEVRGLLAADARETIGPLRSEPLKAMLEATPPAMEEPAPERIGPYKIEGLIGEGGFGAVYLARQTEPVDREVAIKMVRPGMSTRESLRRFERERRTLANLEHPGIARLLDAGATPEGRPYFVMELVRGEAITTYCDRACLSTRARLRLFIEVCEAIQHAHQRGVIHRDIKPSNVLVAAVDGQARLKVIDFGIAGVVEGFGARRPGDTLATAAGQFIGTPEYMSPEQAAASPADGEKRVVDTRSDVYSLGVLLHEMLTGTVPHSRAEVIAATLRDDGAGGRVGGKAEIAGASALRVGDHVETRRPSGRLTGMGDSLDALAAAHGTDARTLVREVRGDLDWIVLKALQRDPARRYASVHEMAEDIRRSMASLPISAHAPSTREVAAKFVRRHRVAVIGAACVVGALVMGMIGTSVGLVRARDAAALAERRRAEAEYEAYTGRIAAAAGALEASGPVNLRGWLDECPQRLRGWEWNYLHALSDQSEGVAATAKGGVQGLAVSADGQWCAVAARQAGEVIVLRCARSGARWCEVARLRLLMPESVRFSPDGTRLACACREGGGAVRIFDTATWRPVEGSWCNQSAWDVAWSPDGRSLAVLRGAEKWEGHGTVTIVDVGTGRELVDTGLRGFAEIAWSADGRWIAAGDATGVLGVWDVEQRAVALERRLTKNKVTGVAFSAGGLLAACEDNGAVTVLRAEDGWPVECVLDQSRSPGLRAAFSPDGSRLAVASWSSTAWVWNVATRTLERELRGHGSLLHGVAWEERAGRHALWTGSYDGDVRVWSMDSAPQAVRMAEEANDPWVSVSADGQWCAAWSTPGRLSVLRMDGAQEVASVKVRRGVGMGFRFLPDSRHLVVSDRDGSVAVVDPWTGERIVRAKTPGDGMRISAMSPSGRYVAGLCSGHGCVVVDLEKGEVVWGAPEAKATEAIAFEGERTLLVHSRTGVLERWDLAAGERLGTGDPRTGEVFAGAASADGHWVATAAYDGRITLMDATGLSIVASAKIDQSPGMLMFTPDGSRLISTGGDGLVRFWETPSMRQMAAIRAAKAWVHGAMTADGKTLVVKWTGSVMKVWKTR